MDRSRRIADAHGSPPPISTSDDDEQEVEHRFDVEAMRETGLRATTTKPPAGLSPRRRAESFAPNRDRSPADVEPLAAADDDDEDAKSDRDRRILFPDGTLTFQPPFRSSVVGQSDEENHRDEGQHLHRHLERRRCDKKRSTIWTPPGVEIESSVIQFSIVGAGGIDNDEDDVAYHGCAQQRRPSSHSPLNLKSEVRGEVYQR